jgi:P-type E1-E2 ATPase
MLAGGQALEYFADSRARRELSSLLQRAPRVAHRCDGQTVTSIDVEEVALGDLLLIKPGDVVPVDGVVVGKPAVLDEAALTGEAVPVEHREGEQVRSGAINSARGPFKMRAIALARDSTYAGIVRLVEEAQASKSSADSASRSLFDVVSASYVSSCRVRVDHFRPADAPWLYWS